MILYDFHMSFQRTLFGDLTQARGHRSENLSLPLNFSHSIGDLHCLTVGQRECVSISRSCAGSAIKLERTHAGIYFPDRTRLEGSGDCGAGAPCKNARRQHGTMVEAYLGVQQANRAAYLLCGVRLSAIGRGRADRTVIRRASAS